MKILVTGGLGFIGTNFIRFWKEKYPKDDIINLDKMTYAAILPSAKDVGAHYRFVKGDITNSRVIEKLVKESDTVINFAAETHVDRSITNPGIFIKSNIIGVYTLLEAVRKYETRFHQVSTDEVYGSLEINSSKKFNEGSRYNPQNPYSATKAAGDHLVNSYFNTYKLPLTISNSSNNFGPYQYKEKLIPKTIINALRNKPIPIYGNGLQMRDWIYVADQCSALEMILSKGEYGRTYLISANNVLSNIEVVKSILEKLGKSRKLIRFVSDRKGHDKKYALDSKRLTEELGWKPKFTFEEGMTLTLKYYKALY